MQKEISQYFDLILELDKNWQVSKIETDHKHNKVSIHIKYIGKGSPIYDHLKEREWRHLDIMDYQTYLVSKVPRIKNSS